MSLLTDLVSLLTLITLVHGLQPLSPNRVLNTPLSSPPLSLIRLNLSSANNWTQSVNAANANAMCSGSRFGSNLNKTSCKDVWMKIPTDSENFTFGARTQGSFERPLPLRYLSDDGLCAIDVNHNKHREHDTATNQDISTAARLILDDCVLRIGREKTLVPVGGLKTNVGTNNGLLIKILSYSADVQCVPGPTEFEDRSVCLKILNTMSASHPRYPVTRDTSVKGQKIWIPPGGKKLLGGSSQCLGKIDFQQQGDTIAKDLSSWYEMWAAAVAVNEMCVRFGQAGTAYGLGFDKTLTLSLGHP